MGLTGRAFVARLVVEIAVPELWGLDRSASVDNAPAETRKLHGNADRVPLHGTLHALLRILRLNRTYGCAHGCRLPHLMGARDCL